MKPKKNRPASRRIPESNVEVPVGRKTAVASLSFEPEVLAKLRETSKESGESISYIVNSMVRTHLIDKTWSGDCWPYANICWKRMVSHLIACTDAKPAADPASCGEQDVDIFLPQQKVAAITSPSPTHTHNLRDLVGSGAILGLKGLQLAIVMPCPTTLPIDWREVLEKSSILILDPDQCLDLLSKRKVSVGFDL